MLAPTNLALPSVNPWRIYRVIPIIPKALWGVSLHLVLSLPAVVPVSELVVDLVLSLPPIKQSSVVFPQQEECCNVTCVNLVLLP